MGFHRSAESKGEWRLSQPRPLTLLIACGVLLAAAVLVITGLVAGYLRQQTLASTEAGLSRLDSVLVEAGNRTLLSVEAVLSDVSSHIRLADMPRPDAVARQIGEAALGARLERVVEAAPQIAGIALVAPDGTVVLHTGAWPSAALNVVSSDYFAALQANQGLESAIGAPLVLDGAGGADVIPVAHKLRAVNGDFAGVAIATVPVSHFENLYRVVPLGEDGVIALMRRDGTVLAQFPSRSLAGTRSAADAAVLAALGDGAQGVFEESANEHGGWYIDAVQPLGDYPVSVVVSASGPHALVGWSRQAMMFAAFAACGMMTIGLMVVLIGRQIHTHNVLAAMRAEKIENEHARLVAEAELLKKERLSVLGQFTATVANELRNPLSAIRNTLFTMREMATTSGLALDRPIARIQRSIARCDRIIGDLLEYIRTPELTRVSVNFDDWLREVLVEHGLPPAVTLVQEYSAGDAIVRVDADRIRHVVINLVDNAAQALAEMPSDRPRRIAVRSAIVDDALALTVEDTGPGIPQENMTRIFEPLFSTKSFGAGLGLATVKQIVVQHNGTIGIASTVGEGTIVTIRLPIERALLKVAA